MKIQIKPGLWAVFLSYFLFQMAAYAQDVPSVERFSIEDLLDSITYRGLSFSHDGTQLLTSSNESGISNAVSVDLKTRKVIRLTQSVDQAVNTISYFPNDDRVLLRADNAGNERAHIFLRNTDGTQTDLTPGRRHIANFHGWAADDQSFFIRDNKRNPRTFDLYELDIVSFQEELIFENGGLYNIGPVSPDKQYIALSKRTNNRSAHLLLLDRKSGEMTELTLEGIYVSSRPLAFSPDGEFLYYATDKWHDFQYVAKYALNSGETTEVYKLDWDIRGIQFSKDGERIAISSNQNARTVVEIFDTATMQKLGSTDIPAASVASYALSADGSQIAFIETNGKAPGNIRLQQVGNPTSDLLVGSLSEKIDPEQLVAGEVVRFNSYDGLSIPGILYRPRNRSANNPGAAMVRIHGGPGGESRLSFNPTVQYLVNRGYLVYAVNNRGSGGSGKTFNHLDDHRHGRADLDDIVAARRWLANLDYVDSDRIAVIGGSYGGYLTLAALAFRPGEFNLGVDMYGVTDWLATLEKRPPWWESNRQSIMSEFGDRLDVEYWRALAPAYHGENIRVPLLVLQGANDPRVHKSDVDVMVEAVRKNNERVEYIVFEDEGHGFRKKKNQIIVAKAVESFLEKYLH